MKALAIPVLASLNFSETQLFYGRLGFTVVSSTPDYLIMTRQELELQFWQCHDPHVAQNTSCYMRCEDVEPWYQVCNDLGLAISDLEDKPWGMREFALWDLSGNLLRFGQPSCSSSSSSSTQIYSSPVSSSISTQTSSSSSSSSSSSTSSAGEKEIGTE